MQSGGLWTVLKGGLIHSPAPTPTWAAKWRSRGLTLMNDERRAYDLRPQHDDHQHHPRPGGERQHQQRGQGHPPARDGGRQRFTRPGRTATRYGKDRWRYDL